MRKNVLSVLLILLFLGITVTVPVYASEEGTLDETGSVVEKEIEIMEEVEEHSDVVEETTTEGSENLEFETECEIENEVSGNVVSETVSGQCGDNLIWTLENNVLKITGSGEMWHFTEEGGPWKSYISEATSLELGKEITTIGSNAFRGCKKLTGNLIIPESVETIAGAAFYQCSGLKGDLIIPNSVKLVDWGAFYDCSGFDGVIKLSENMTNIEPYSFYNCKNLKGDLVIPNGVGRIGGRSFMRCENLNGKLILPDSLTNIDGYAFFGCYNLTGNLIIPDNTITIDSIAFYRCYGFNNIVIGKGTRKFLMSDVFEYCTGVKNIITKADTASIYSGSFRYVNARGFCSTPVENWEGTNSNGKGNIEWQQYVVGNETLDYPQIYVATSQDSTLKYYLETGYNTSSFLYDTTLLYMAPYDNGKSTIIYEDVDVEIILSEGLSFSNTEKIDKKTYDVGVMDGNDNLIKDIEAEIYISGNEYHENFGIEIVISAKNHEQSQIIKQQIPVEIIKGEMENGIVSTVEKYTSGEDSYALNEILSMEIDDVEKQKLLFEYFNCDNMFDVSNEITRLQNSSDERNAYNALIHDDMYLAWQYQDFLNSEEGIPKRIALYTAGLLFNNELSDWLDPTTYIDQDLPGIKKYKTLLKEFINKQKDEVEYMSYIKETEKFISGLAGTTSDIEKDVILSRMKGTQNIEEAKSIFNDFVAVSIPNDEEVIIVYDEKTQFMKAMGWSGKIVKIGNSTCEGIDEWMEMSSSLENYRTYEKFLLEVYNAKELPWEMRVAAFQLIGEMEQAYLNPMIDILNGVRDVCLSEAFDIVEFSKYLNFNGYLDTIDFSAWLINTFLVDIGEMVNNSAYTEGYAYLAMHYRDKLKNASEEFNKNKNEENAWAFYEAYAMLWRLRQEGEEMYLTLNNVDDGLLASVIRDCTGYVDKEAAVKDNLERLSEIKFQSISGESLPKEYQYLQKIVIECPVSVEILTDDNMQVCVLEDGLEKELVNDYGKFVTVYRATTGDYVKIAYLHDNSSYKIRIIAKEEGTVCYTVAKTQDHKTFSQQGFIDVSVIDNAIIETETVGEKYYIDSDGDGTTDIEGEHADKSKKYVQFNDQINRQIKVVYCDEYGKVPFPEKPVCKSYAFMGWYTQPGGLGELFLEDTCVNDSIAVYAFWKYCDEVIPSDIPAGGDIPEGIWAAGVEDFTYSGSKIKQSFRVYDNNKLLKEKTDYTITYKNNKNAYTYTDEDYSAFEENLKKTGKRVAVGTFNPTKAPQVTIKMKGNYSGSQTIYFKIEPEDITEEVFKVDNLTVTYTGKKQTPTPKLMWNGKALKYGTDYYIPEYDAAKKDKTAFKEKGTYSLTITGKKNFTGEIPIMLTISESAKQIAMNKVSIKGIKNLPWTGEQLTQTGFTVKYKSDVLSEENGDYTISFGTNKDVGIGTVTFTGTGQDTDGDGFSYIGTKTVSFKITGTAMSKVTVSGVEKSYPFTGTEIKPTASLSYKANKNVDAIPLTEGIHYTVDYQKNVNKGTATIVFTGMESGGYTGTKKHTFKITASGISDITNDDVVTEQIQITFKDAENVKDGIYVAPHMKGGAKPEVIVTSGDVTLELDKDYTISYANNKKPALSTDKNAPSFTVKGKGNYTGSKKVYFTIVPKALTNENGITVVAKDKVESTKNNGYRQSFKVYDADGKALGNKDYDNQDVTYTLIQTSNADGTINNVEELLNNNSVVPSGSVIQITVKGKGNYAGGTATGTYRILENSHDISKATIQIDNQDYTGKPILITEQSQFKEGKVFIKIGKEKKELILGEDIEVVPNSYVKNVNKGTAKVTFRGINDFGGTKTVTFKIGTRSINDFWHGIFAKLSELWD